MSHPNQVEIVCQNCGSIFSKCAAVARTRRFCGMACTAEAKRREIVGENNPNWRGGIRIDTREGRVSIYAPDHPNARKDKSVYAYRLAIEEATGTILPRHLVVHHRNGDPSDDRIENLQAMPQSKHAAIEIEKRLIGPDGKRRITGVRKTPSGSWQARTRIGQKEHHLGTFEDRDSAIRAVKAFREFAR